MSPQEELRLAQLQAEVGHMLPSASSFQPQPTGDQTEHPGFWGRLGRNVGNWAVDIPMDIGSSVRNIIHMAGGVSPEARALAQADMERIRQDYRPFDVPDARPGNVSDMGADIISGIGKTLAELYVPGSAATKGARLLGAGRFAPIVGDVAAGAFLGAQQSPEEMAGTGAEFGALGATRFLPRVPRIAANFAIPIAGQLLRGHDPTSPESMVSTGAQVIFGSLGKRIPLRDEVAPMPTITPDEVIPPGRQFALPGPTVAQSGQHWRQLPWSHGEARTFSPSGEPIVTHPATIPRETLALPGPTVPASGQTWRMLEWPHGEARAFTPTGEAIPMPNRAPNVEVIPPEPLLKRAGSQPNPVSRTIEEAINAKDIVRYAGQKGHLTRGEDGIYFRPMNKGAEMRVYGDLPSDPLASIEGVDLKWAGKSSGKSLLRRTDEGRSGFADVNNPAFQYLAGAGAGAIAGPAVFQDEDMSIGEKMLRGAGTGAALVGLGRGLMRAPQAIRDAQKLGVLPEPLRKLMPKVEQKLETAADDQMRNRPSLLGRMVRTAEREFGLNRNEDVTLAQERGRGFASQQFRQASDAVKSLRNFTPAERTAAEQFMTSPRTVVEEARLRSTLPAEKADAVLNLDKTKRTLQRQLSAAEKDPRKKALYSQTEGTWITRSYEAFLDPEKWKPDAAHRTDMVDYLQNHPDFKGYERWQIENAVDDYGAEVRRQAMGQAPQTQSAGSKKIDRTLYTHKKDLTPAEWQFLDTLRGNQRLTAHEKTALNDIITEETISPASQQFLKTLAKNPVLGASDQKLLDTISGKKVLPKQFRNYLGEISDPVQAEVLSVNKLLKSAANAKTLAELDSMGKAGTLPIYDTQSQATAMNAAVAAGDTAKIAELRGLVRVPDAPGFGVLSGKMAPRQVVDALNAHNELWQAPGGWMRGLTSWMKKVLVPYNPSSHAAQWMQTPLMGMIARVAPWDMWEAGQMIRSKGALYDELVRNHIIGADFSTQELQKGARELSSAFAPSKTGKVLAPIRKADSAIQGLYGVADNLVRSAAYMKRKAAFLKQGMSDAEAQAAATKWVNRYTTNYGTVPNAVKVARNTPFVSPFVTYTVEITRIIKNLAEDLISGAAEDKAWAAANLGTLVAMPLMIAGAAKAGLSDKDREEWERINELSPDYARNQIRVPLGKDKSGAFKYLNLSRLSPAGDLVSMARNILSGDLEMLATQNPYVGVDKSPAWNAMAEQISGRETMTGRKLMDAGDRARALASKVVPPLTPGLGYEGRRLQDAFTPNAEGTLGVTNKMTGRTDTPTDALMGLFAIRTGRVKESQLLKSKKGEMNEEVSRAKGELKAILRTNATADAKAKARKEFKSRQQEIQAKYKPLLKRA